MRKSNSFLKHQRERERAARAAEKRARKLEKKRAKKGDANATND